MRARPCSDLFKAMLKLNPPPQIDGVLAANDAMALGAMRRSSRQQAAADRRHQCQQGSGGFIKAGDMLASGDYNGLIEAAWAPKSRSAR